ncbi:5-(carboxyamino)imidazole ribonucleotide mutase [Candidatus Curtissbacteria bacterium RIFCSPHIGHO2_01_FULL_41_44]|uniref:N5-carboxyaminoimidazole ribonucleotide mutase n=1 Tax=Candidatus Curtissbacteria bacterium RIFCSPLOWO2_01_FULL_42_50 TaxID=1797730 RepID=A0A1F5H555_9BACT|nr:MAG: 5-(carboxyamino)imidazole ribonucleotide mutase [Candidatus Curtissbacteria bacterium RIFCSPHIGHO2_02_FULL_42_58]OGD93834.1 MAG: 5-(carboxyamino)imidazole ribonucleotide mutase [Candidatus Curtissbacteria bacterium RIFCSPHIGHO2_01_FULL_41_44]OGD97483.1 MAG: 5-(carboxyamino)imidazole ribonucleotide mutase [Candidatus Curtissbacteria bacterium RIFCSPHIGHO2_12_FULL_42_33]OGD99260.1 MAG: 5-(carboxyamino)imidazole ribonucleotide mutase [Candidatus Curtissbacteria bacterium RIFCSPLOWO2_01_FULL
MTKPQVGIVMGSDSDLEIMVDTAKIFDELEIPYEISILSAHRTPEETAKYAKNAKAKGIKVLIAAAGGAAALPGSVAAATTLPVIGVPIKAKSMEGLDSLLSIVQMPPSVPVATVGVNSAKNAGLLAAQMIALGDSKIAGKVAEYKDKVKKEVLAKNSKLQKIGWDKYLKEKDAK